MQKKKVIVVGMGISGGDISAEIVEDRKCLQVIRSTRRYEKFRVDTEQERDPYISEKILKALCEWGASYSLIRPICDKLMHWAEHNGWLYLEKELYKPFIKEIEERAVIFTDGSRVICDVILFCTGFKLSFPFLDKDIINKLHISHEPTPSVAEAYKHVFLPEYPNLAFLGILHVSGSLHPPVERQAEWFSAILSGRVKLPPSEEMQADIDRWKQQMRAKKAVRPMMVNQKQYMDEIEGLIRS